jgi:hypothetical protein
LERQKCKEDISIVKIPFVDSPDDTRRHERPKRICVDHVENDLKHAHGVRTWILKHSVREDLAANVSKAGDKLSSCHVSSSDVRIVCPRLNVQVLQGPYLPSRESRKYQV